MSRPISQLREPPPCPRSIIPTHIDNEPLQSAYKRLRQLRARRADLKWGDFDHSLDQYLGFKKQVRIVYPRETYHLIALRSCNIDEYTTERLGLINITESHYSFTPTICVFPYQKKTHIGSELLDISLYDLVSSPVPLLEAHVKAILHNVSLQLPYEIFN
jgi:hypothetical protein